MLWVNNLGYMIHYILNKLYRDLGSIICLHAVISRNEPAEVKLQVLGFKASV